MSQRDNFENGRCCLGVVALINGSITGWGLCPEYRS